MAPRRRTGGEIDRHAGSAAGVARRIEAGSATERVSASPTGQGIIAVAASERVSGCATNKRVVAEPTREHIAGGAAEKIVGAGRADEIFDAREGIARRLANRRRPSGKIDDH